MALTMILASSTLISLLITTCIILIANKAFTVERNDNEPPFVPSVIPHFGHLLGLFWHKNQYYTKLRSKQCGLQIYSLAMPSSRLYVVNSPNLVLSLQRQPNVVSFWFLEAKFTATLGGMSKDASEKLKANLQSDRVSHSLLLKGLKATHQAMTPGKAINQMIHIAGQRTVKALDAINDTLSTGQIDLRQWVRHEITMITTESVYGPLNPYRDPEVERAFWEFADNSLMLSTGIMPSVLASKGNSGREKVVRALEEYFAVKGHESGSDLVKARFQILQNDIGPKDIARFECVNGMALLVNTVPTAFWTIYHTFASTKILASVRDHIHTILSIEEQHGQIFRTIDLSRLKEVPILTSVLQESLRHRATGAGPRMVLEDTILDNRYLLKRDSYLIIPNHEMHFDLGAWGESVMDFDAQRFIRSGSNKIPPGAFRGFGGGVNLCPGKAFATTEVVALLAMLAMRYEMKPTSGQWTDPQQDMTNMSLAISPPQSKIIVEMLPREGLRCSSWALKP